MSQRRRERLARDTNEPARADGTAIHPATRRWTPGLALGVAALLALGIMIGARFFPHDDRRACRERYTYVNSLVACGERPVIDKRGYEAFRGDLASFLRARAASGLLRDASVYFRDLVQGPIFAIDEFAQFVPASLMKLPLVVAYLAAEEDAPGFIEQTLVYDGARHVPGQRIAPAVTLRPGEAYEIATLLANTLRFSDNASYLLLRDYLRSLRGGDALLLQTYRDLGVVDPNDVLDETVSVRAYASLFRILYNASYLSPELSERALGWLAQSEFTEGLAGGVPAGVVVAHKFGERELTGPEAPVARVQFHDCGIVYYPKNPYLLCVMTRGNQLPALIETVRLISAMVWQEVASRSPARRVLGLPGR